jgi:TonB family protein
MERIFKQFQVTIFLAAISSIGLAQSSVSVIGIPPPIYPMKEKEAGHSGIVHIAIKISADGNLAKAKISRSSGFPKLDKSALEAVKKGKFLPAKDASGQPVGSEGIVPISFVTEIGSTPSPGIEPAEEQRAYLIKMLSMSCSLYQDRLLTVSASEQKKPSESYNFRFPLILFEVLMQSERKLGKSKSLIADSETFFQRYDKQCALDPKRSAYETFASAVHYKP